MPVIDFPSANMPREPNIPQHIAIIMDGNRRWAKHRGLPGAMGHAWGAKRVKGIVKACADCGVSYLTLFAFSTENWRRSAEEVSSLMGLFFRHLENEANDMVADGIRLKVVGDLTKFPRRLQDLMSVLQQKTANNRIITLTIAANYGGRWDMLRATQRWKQAHPNLSLDELTEESIRPFLSMDYAPDPELLIRTGDESRISNFMLWQSAYTEFYFSPLMWPDFERKALVDAMAWYASRKRRFGSDNLAS